MKIITLIMALLLSGYGYADAYSYSCQIHGEYVLGNDGKLTPNEKIYFGGEFNVERKSGVVLGGGVGNSSYPTKTVIDFGGKNQAYKLIWLSRDVTGTNGGKNAVYLTIEEYNENEFKPFSMIVSSRVLTGVCK